MTTDKLEALRVEAMRLMAGDIPMKFEHLAALMYKSMRHTQLLVSQGKGPPSFLAGRNRLFFGVRAWMESGGTAPKSEPVKRGPGRPRKDAAAAMATPREPMSEKSKAELRASNRRKREAQRQAQAAAATTAP